MVKHNNVIPNAHFHKDWKLMVKTWFNQPAKKHARRLRRAAKAAKIAPCPANGLLRPEVHCPTQRYNMKVRLGRGFSLDELKQAGISKHYAPTVGIPIDHRRRNKSVEVFQRNVERLKSYLSKLVVFPLHKKTPKKGDSSAAEIAAATQFKGEILPIMNSKKQEVSLLPLSQELKSAKAFMHLQQARTNARLVGVRAKKAKETKDAEDAKIQKA